MAENVEKIYSSVITRIFYVIALLMVIGPMGNKLFRRLDRFISTIEIKGFSSEFYFGVFTRAILLTVILLLVYRIILVVANKAKLEFYRRDRFTYIIRQIGLAIIFIGIIGYLLVFVMAYFGGGVFMVFGTAFKYVVPFGLLIFESSRILSYEQN